MITKPDITDLLKKSSNRYELVNIISRRARQINAGDVPKVDTKEQAEVTIASEEFFEDKFRMVNGEEQEVVDSEETQEIEENN